MRKWGKCARRDAQIHILCILTTFVEFCLNPLNTKIRKNTKVKMKVQKSTTKITQKNNKGNKEKIQIKQII